jgi:hypothetical protein
MNEKRKSKRDKWNNRNRDEEIEQAEKRAVYQVNSGTGKGEWIDMDPYL